MKVFRRSQPGTALPSVPWWLIMAAVLAVLFLSLVPILLVGQYAVPYADDFSFSCETHSAITSGGSLLQVLAGAAEKVRDVYYTWQGTFSGIFLMAFQPGIFGLSAYSMTPAIMLCGLITGTFLFCFTFFSDVFGLRKSVTGILAAVISICCIQLVPNPNQSFYWYNGAVYYTFTFGLTALCYSVVLCYVLRGGAFRLILSILLAIVIGGSNFVTALETVILFFCLTAFLALRKNRRWKTLLLPLLAVTAALLVSVLAPGNAVRQAEYSETPGPFRAVLLSFLYALKFIVGHVSLPYAGLMLFLVPVLYYSVCSVPEEKYAFFHPVPVTLFSFCIFASLFTPHLYAEGSIGPDRLIDLYYYFFIFLSVIDLFFWIGLLCRHRKNRENGLKGIPLKSFMAAGAALVLCLLLSLVTHSSSYTSLIALGELRNGEAAEYYRQAQLRQTVLEDSSVTDCVFEPYTVQPYLLFFGDLSEDPTYYANEDACTFYGKKSIIVS